MFFTVILLFRQDFNIRFFINLIKIFENTNSYCVRVLNNVESDKITFIFINYESQSWDSKTELNSLIQNNDLVHLASMSVIITSDAHQRCFYEMAIFFFNLINIPNRSTLTLTQ